MSEVRAPSVGGTDRARVGAPHPVLGAPTRRVHPAVGPRPTVTFILAALLTAGYVGFGVWVSASWRGELEQAIGPVMAWVIPITLAYVPGITVGLLLSTLLFSRYREPLRELSRSGRHGAQRWPAVTILIAARNEEQAIVPTIEGIGGLSYAGEIEVVLADNDSTDRTAELAARAAARLGLRYRRVLALEPGKHWALNAALSGVGTPVVVTVDADTILQRHALTYLVARVTDAPQQQHVSACAGALVPANARTNFVTRMQQWDYRLAINGVKRMQAAYNSTLVAQGAFSAYWTEDLRAVGGWPDAIGEDIVMTWDLMGARGLVQYEPMALAFTAVPEKVSQLMRQRSRWARGMLEGLRRHPPWTQPRNLAKLVAGVDYLVPLLDVGIVFFWLPGLILFIFGYPLIVGWWSMLVLPISLVGFGLLRRWQERHVFRRLGVDQAPDKRGFVGYLAVYRVPTSAAAIRGYLQYALGSSPRWK